VSDGAEPQAATASSGTHVEGELALLLVGDVFGSAGRDAVRALVPALRQQHGIDVVVANGENAARGSGLTARLAGDLFDAGVDGITLGNHAFRQRDIFPMLNTDTRIVRPANVPRKAPGRGLSFIDLPDGRALAMINLMGALFLDVAAGPFEVIDELVDQARARTSLVLVDFHAEATSEKVAMGQYLDGRVSVVAGTHTHVQTSDARVLAGGTAYVTDLGMTGPHDSVIGVRSEIILRKLTTGIGERFEPASTGVQLEGAVVRIDLATGLARSIEAIRVPLDPASETT
jgi:metallophosphoesterase (TIGR00282 family)